MASDPIEPWRTTVARAAASTAETHASGNGSRPNDDVHAVTGAASTSFAEFAQRTASAWAVEVAK
jgi:hypothetical protein